MKKKITYLAIALASCLAVTGCNDKGDKSTVSEKSTDAEKVGYSIGYMMGLENKEAFSDLNLETFYEGFRDAYKGKDDVLTKKQMEETLLNYQKQRQEKMMQEVKALAEKNKKEGEKFLAENKAKEGVKTTKSGLQYKVLQAGEGESPKATDIVTVNYEGKLVNGKVFDTSYKDGKGTPIQFPLNQVIKGWTEGVQLMNKGAKYEIVIPSNLGYGESGSPNIEPNSTLIFTVELLDFKSAPAQKKK